jgi:ring-1,2-phenylacetyl-CoA epoxidase subunit PaaD
MVSAGPEGARRLRELVAAIPDPELPMLSIGDLGILREVRVEADRVEVDVTPTYSGCPAMDVIRADVEAVCRGQGWSSVVVRTMLAPPWTTEWVSGSARQTLREHGIAPPGPLAPGAGLTMLPLSVAVAAPAAADCPHCGSADTEQLSVFSSTACKALHRCRSCGEPFERFKAH